MNAGIFKYAIWVGLLLRVSAYAAPSIFDTDPPSAPARTKTPDPTPAPAAESPQPGAPAPGSPAPAPTKKTPIPDAAAQKQAGASIDQVYANDIAKARTPEQKQALVKRIMATNPEGSDDAATRYVLLCRIRDLAADAGDVPDALAADDELDRTYAVNGTPMRAELLSRMSKTAITAADFKLLFQSAIRQMDQAMEGDQYVQAFRFAEIAEALAHRSGDAALVTLATARAREEREAAAAYGPVKRSLEELAKNAANPDANLRAGRFYCFARGEWTRGLLMLSKSSDRALAALANREAHPASGATAWLEIADSWADLMPREAALTKGAIAMHAMELYRQALPSLSGLEKLRVERKMNELREAAKLAPLYLRRNSGISELVVEALIDGNSELHITPEGIYWKERGVAKPGRWNGHNEPTDVNGVAWMPMWGKPDKDRGNDQTELYRLPIGALDWDYKLLAVTDEHGGEGIQARTPIQFETRDGEQVLTIPDPEVGAKWYRVRFFRSRGAGAAAGG